MEWHSRTCLRSMWYMYSIWSKSLPGYIVVILKWSTEVLFTRKFVSLSHKKTSTIAAYSPNPKCKHAIWQPIKSVDNILFCYLGKTLLVHSIYMAEVDKPGGIYIVCSKWTIQYPYRVAENNAKCFTFGVDDMLLGHEEDMFTLFLY